ncbi:FUSC family protein [Microbacterium gallinarum]|uniref:FUSC family protein n=1 Tax=Microbacterium gallinarum TaxID=2762209 RepID=A0ABR8WZW4_9MICO|nr:FUSC family protein [Microbacterium gallinarum]MBD8022630.1 FUSC family protein [Microbacterium gallinarum]
MTRRVMTAPARWLRAMTEPGRLLLALKTGVAAALAWYLAPLLPITDDQYSYYAPLGVLVSMYPTVAASARSGLQAIIGLAMGIGLGLLGIAALSAGVPGVLALAIVVGVGVLFGGVQALGVGRDWVAIAALFVLLLSGGDTEDFTLSYLVTMAFGVVVGILANFVIVPPLYLERASARLSELRDTLSALLEAIADHVQGGAVDAEAFEAALAELDQTAADVRVEVYEADESRKVNPRGRRHRSKPQENLDRLQALERAVFYAREFADVLVALARANDVTLGRDVSPALSHAIRTCAALVATPVHADESPTRLEEANAALEQYVVALSEVRGGGATFVAHQITPAAFLRRTIDASVPFVRTDSAEAPD